MWCGVLRGGGKVFGSLDAGVAGGHGEEEEEDGHGLSA
jgi:hypothetical protein